MDIDDIALSDFAVNLNELYETLSGLVRLEEPYSMHCFLEILNDTYLRGFAKALFADYGKYAE